MTGNRIGRQTFMNIFCVIICTHTISLYAQKTLADSVQKILSQPGIQDSTRAKDMVFLAMFNEPIDVDKAHRLYADARSFAGKNKLDYYTALSWRYEAILYSFQSRYDSTQANLDRALHAFKQLNTHAARIQEGNCYNDLGSLYTDKNEPTKGIAYFLKEADLFKKEDMKSNLILCYVNLANAYQVMKVYDKEKENLDKALIVAQQLKARRNLFEVYAHLSLYFSNVQDSLQGKKYADTAGIYFYENLEYSDKYTYYIIAELANENLHRYDSALYFTGKAYDLALAYKNSGSWAVGASVRIASVYAGQKKYHDAEKVLSKAIPLAEKDSLKFPMKEGYRLLATIYENTGRFKEALDYFKRFKIMETLIASEEQKKFADELEKKYETEKKEAQIKTLESEKKIQLLSLHQKNILNYALIGIAATLLIISALLFTTYKQKQQLQQKQIAELEKEKKLLAAQAVLQGQEEERTRLAKDLHDGLGGILSGAKYAFSNMKNNLIITAENAEAFERSMSMLDKSISELRRVAHNMMPEALVKFGLDTALKDYCNSITQSGAIELSYQSFDIDDASIPKNTASVIYRIIQELINNIQKHAAAKTALVQLVRKKEALSITVEDDGKGFDKNILLSNTGIGYNNLTNRITFLNGTMDVETAPGKGVSINIEIPNITV